MKRVVFALVMLGLAGPALAMSQSSVQLYVDSAPNVYGSPDWAPWWAAAQTDVVAGTFQNLRTGTFPGTLSIDPYDEIVYSTGDLGKRIHWIYWVPDETTTSLDGLFEVKWVIDWGGDNWTYESGGWAADGPEVGWSQPSKWENYDDGQGTTGVIGSLGFAWWSIDDDALPGDTGGSPYDEVNQDDIDALRNDVFNAQTFATGLVRWRNSTNDDWMVSSLTVTVVPLPAALFAGLPLLGGLVGSSLVRRRRRA